MDRQERLERARAEIAGFIPVLPPFDENGNIHITRITYTCFDEEEHDSFAHLNWQAKVINRVVE